MCYVYNQWYDISCATLYLSEVIYCHLRLRRKLVNKEMAGIRKDANVSYLKICISIYSTKNTEAAVYMINESTMAVNFNIALLCEVMPCIFFVLLLPGHVVTMFVCCSRWYNQNFVPCSYPLFPGRVFTGTCAGCHVVELG